MPDMKQNAGMTLIEIMIVVTIVAALAVLALPSYDRYVRRGNRAVAKATLLEITSRQESWLSDRKAYSTSLLVWKRA